MTVINPKSISGITSITMPSGADNVLTIHTTDGTERLRIDSSGNVKVGSAATISPDGDLFVTGVCTATTLSGAASGLTGALPAISAANLTNVPAANITGTLPAISALNLTNVPAANVVGVHTSLNVTGSTIVGGGVTISESGIEASGIGITCANINGTQIGGRRNIVINGAMMVAQRGTSSTTSGYGSVDRIQHIYSGTDEAPTFSQADIASGTTPYSLGFRKSIKVTNGNQTSGAGAGDFIRTNYLVEAQDVVNSGWDYNSSSSFITVSFWVKSSVAQNFYGYLYTFDGTNYYYPYETGSLTANTWTKITKTIPGNSNITVDNNNASGINIALGQFWGTNYTASPTLNQWATWATDARTPDYTSTWYTTNDATFEMTGLQLEVGSQATPFEHRSYDEQLALCQRYYQDWQDWTHPAHRGLDGNYDGHIIIDTLRINMRANPTITSTSYGWIANGNSWVDGSNSEAASLHNDPSSDYPGRYIKITGVHNWDSNYNNTIAVKFVVAKFDAEL